MMRASRSAFSNAVKPFRRDGLLQVSAGLLGVVTFLYVLGCTPQSDSNKPTPTDSNTPTPADQVASPTFDPPDSAEFTSLIDVEISCATGGATIRYTTDGSTPTPSSGTIYASAIHLTDTTTIKAIAYKDGMTDSAVATATYTKGGGPDPNTLTLDLGDGVTMVLVKVPAGQFEMGTSSTDAGWFDHSRPMHTVTFGQAFYMGKYEVTQAQWRAVMGTDPSSFTGDDRPVERVSWHDAVAFCEALSTKTGRTIRLPSEAEWEYACKAGSGDTKWHFGDDEGDLGQYAWYWSNSSVSGTRQTHDVGGKLPNAFGLYDMHGNVWEWCQDWWNSDYTGAPSDGSAWTTGDSSYRVLRGGSWYHDARRCRSAYRSWFSPSDASYCLGFRVVVAVGVN